MDYREELEIAASALLGLKGHTVDVLTVSRPSDLQGAVEISKIVSKLSPIIGNLLEYALVRHLNETQIWPEGCRWIRQDPGFPDAILSGMPDIQPGIEVKTWFPLSTEITARFRAIALVDSWGDGGKEYRPERDCQIRLRQLIGRFPYRLDTNFAKMDRIVLPSLETFKTNVLGTLYAGRTIQSWARAINSGNPTALQSLIDPSAPTPVQ